MPTWDDGGAQSSDGVEAMLLSKVFVSRHKSVPRPRCYSSSSTSFAVSSQSVAVAGGQLGRVVGPAVHYVAGTQGKGGGIRLRSTSGDERVRILRRDSSAHPTRVNDDGHLA